MSGARSRDVRRARGELLRVIRRRRSDLFFGAPKKFLIPGSSLLSLRSSIEKR